MKGKLRILFSESTLRANFVDENFEDEYLAAKQNGLGVLFFNYEDLMSVDRFSMATRKISPNDRLEKVIYRGWMMTPIQYSILYDDLLAKNFQLINTPQEYQNCHYLPDSLRYIKSKTPVTVFEKIENKDSIKKLIEKTKVFGQQPVILKDFVKSEKHHWETACFVKDASNIDQLRQTIENFMQLRGQYLNEGIVVREFIELNDLTIHSKSGMPLTEEYRLFFCHKKLIGVYDYWEEGEYRSGKPITKEFEEIATLVDSNFFSMDIARMKNGEFIIIELGDGQVAGLPDKADRIEFYKQLGKFSADL